VDIFSDSSWREAFELVISTERFGPFTLTANVDLQAIELLFRRVEDAQARFRGSPLAQVANDLEREVVVSSVVGTNTIEGGELTIEQTQLAFELDPETVQEEQQRRVVNIKAAYDLAKNMASKPGWQPDVEYVKDLHRLITLGVSDSHNIPGQLRDNPKNTVTRVGDTEHGGIYKPPQNGRDIAELLKALLVWNASMAERGIPALIRAPLCHVYFELIHPFWDGNGRVGRVLEASILMADGFRYAPFAQANYYLQHIHRYFSLFNQCRKHADNTAFVAFFLQGMLDSINRLHSRVNNLVSLLLFRNHLRTLLEEKLINARQYALAVEVLNHGTPLPVSKLRNGAWYQALYSKLTSKTAQRDLRQLREKKLVLLDAENRLWPGCVEADVELLD
tara:strand:+ start:11226 stop:12401 length:1176 start_codon:yes stop_codon:yes gene_type:complete